MAIAAKWVGIDFGQCLMDPSGLRNYRVIGDVCKEMGEPERIEERIHRYRVLKEKYGSYGAIKEGHRDEILSYVFENDKEAMEIFGAKEQEHLKAAPGTEEALQYLRDQGIERAVVAELKKTLGPIGTDIVTRFLKSKGLLHYFDELVSPQGSVNLRDGSLDLRYKGKTKEEGTLYDELSKDLLKRGIQPSEAIMIGDKLWTDISPAKKRGFRTIQYIGYINYGSSEDADFVISNFHELENIVKGART
jgi:putative hydrolase of the HAD superfamily